METLHILDQNGNPDLEGELQVKSREALLHGEARYTRLAKIVKDRSYAHFRFVGGSSIVDMQTAHLLVTVADALGTKNREKFLAMEFRAMVALAWKLTTM